MKNNILLSILIFSFGIASCDTRDFVYVDDKTFQKQVSSIKEGFVAIVLEIDPAHKNINEKYATAGLIVKENIIEKKTKVSSELIQLVSQITRRGERYTGKEWYPTYDVYIKYTDKFLYLIPSEKYLSLLIDFKNLHIFIEGRKFVLTEQEAELLREKLEILEKLK